MLNWENVFIESIGCQIRRITLHCMVLFALVFSEQAKAWGECSIKNPNVCYDTNELVSSPGFGEAVERFFSGYRGDYVQRNGSAAAQTLDVLGGPPGRRKDIGKLSRFTACMPHNCTQKGIIFVGPSGHIATIGILHSTCVTDQNSACFTKYVLTLFSNAQGTPNHIADDAITWAKQEIDSGNLPGIPFTDKLVNVDKVTLSR